MKKITFIIIAIVSVSCSSIIDERHYEIDPILKPFHDEFMKEAAARGIKFPERNYFIMGIAPLKGSLVGWCDWNNNQITIDEFLIKQNLGHPYSTHKDTLEVEYVCFHELGHYFLNRMHVGDSVKSIMTPHESFMLNYRANDNTRKNMINELFQNKNN